MKSIVTAAIFAVTISTPAIANKTLVTPQHPCDQKRVLSEQADENSDTKRIFKTQD